MARYGKSSNAREPGCSPLGEAPLDDGLRSASLVWQMFDVPEADRPAPDRPRRPWFVTVPSEALSTLLVAPSEGRRANDVRRRRVGRARYVRSRRVRHTVQAQTVQAQTVQAQTKVFARV